MVSVFDLKKLQNLLRDFYEMSHIRITVFDENLNELVSYPREVAPYCRIIRSTERGFDACALCDRNACAVAAKKRQTYIYHCHVGLTEAATPLYVGDVLVGFLLFGHVFSYPSHEAGWPVIQQHCAQLPVNTEKLKQAIFAAIPISQDYIQSAAHILHAVASYVILERIATLQEDQLAVKLDAYLSTHFTESIHASEICGALGIGKTQLYKLSNQLYGCGIAEHIRALRMELARTLLLRNDSQSISQIAAQCGYPDYNYFIAVFSRENGLSPGEYRKTGRYKTGEFGQKVGLRKEDGG